jgi:hypothetical protein
MLRTYKDGFAHIAKRNNGDVHEVGHQSSRKTDHDQQRTSVARSTDDRVADKACVIGLTILMGQVLDIVAVDFCNFWRTRWITMLD